MEKNKLNIPVYYHASLDNNCILIWGYNIALLDKHFIFKERVIGEVFGIRLSISKKGRIYLYGKE